MGSNLVDFHCHLDLYPDFEEVVQRCERAHVFTLTVTTTPKAWARNEEITRRTRHVRAALGLHPQVVAERSREIDLWEDLLPKTRYVGEVGLDAGPRFYGSFEAQKRVFERVLSACSEAGDKIVTVHSVRSAKIVLDMIERFLPPPRGKIVLHWFTGTMSDTRRALDLGCYFSINSEMLAKPAGVKLAAALPGERILTETDGPFTRAGHRAAEPVDVAGTIEKLAAIRGVSAAELATGVFSNLKTILA